MATALEGSMIVFMRSQTGARRKYFFFADQENAIRHFCGRIGRFVERGKRASRRR